MLQKTDAGWQLAGDLNQGNAAACLRDGRSRLAGADRLDLSGLGEIDTSALAVLLAWQREMPGLVLQSPPENLLGLADVYGVQSLLFP